MASECGSIELVLIRQEASRCFHVGANFYDVFLRQVIRTQTTGRRVPFSTLPTFILL